MSVKLAVSIPGIELDQVQEPTEAARQVCPSSWATQGHVTVTLTAVAAGR